MDMTLSSISIGASSINTDSTIGLAMVKKSLDSMEQSGESMAKMLEATVTPHLGQHIDYTV